MICPVCDKSFTQRHTRGGALIYCSEICQCDARDERKRRPLTAARLRELLDYDALTGAFRWRSPARGRLADRVGWTDDAGYHHVRVDGNLYLAHRLAWLWVHGTWPDGNLDHENGVPGTDIIPNLRPATQSQNIANSKRCKRNKSGFKGVSARRGGWRAVIMKDGKQHSLGQFATKEAAHTAYIEAAKRLFGEFARAA